MKRPTLCVLLVGMLLLLLAGCGQHTVAASVTSRPAETSPAPAVSPALTTSLAVVKGTWAAAASGSYNTLALQQNGTLWDWGLNDYGQLGQGSVNFTGCPTPVQVGHLHDWVAVSCGDGDTFALRKDGTLWAWGNNEDWGYNLGLGAGPDRWLPTRSGHAHDWAAVFAGYEHGLAIKKDGSLWAWGPNWEGGLGLGNTNTAVFPTEVGSETDWAAVAAGGDFTVALKKDGTLWACGTNSYGNLGLGDTADRHSFTQVGNASDWAAVSAGIGYSLALKKDGTLWAWGDNSFGELGLGDTIERNVPTQVGSASDWAAVACLGHHSVALKTEGTLWAWGENCYGQLGLGDTTNRLSPTQVGSANDWAAIAPGSSDSYDTVALKTNGTLWAWGFNQFGQLGLGDTRDRHSPAEVGSGAQ